MTDFFEYMLDHKSEEQWETWQRDGEIERTYKDLITNRRFDPSFSQAGVYYPADVTAEKKQQLDTDLEATKAKLQDTNLYEAVLDKGNDFFLRGWNQYVTITDELFLLPWLHYCVLDSGKLLMEEMKHDGYRHLLPLMDEHMLGRRTRTLQPEIQQWLNAHCNSYHYVTVRPIQFNQAYICFKRAKDAKAFAKRWAA